MHILFNGLMMALELAAICAVAWVGFTAPFSLRPDGVVGARLGRRTRDRPTRRYEFPFYSTVPREFDDHHCDRRGGGSDRRPSSPASSGS